MINILASATLDKKNKFKLKRLFATNGSESYVLDFSNGNIVSSTSAKLDDLLSMYKTQHFFVNNVIYTSVRTLQGNDVLSALRMIVKQMEDLQGVTNLDELMFKTVNKYGVDYAE